MSLLQSKPKWTEVIHSLCLINITGYITSNLTVVVIDIIPFTCMILLCCIQLAIFTSRRYFNYRSISSSHVKELKEPFVPYLPAHRQHMQQQMVSTSLKTRDSIPSLSAPIVSLMGLSQQLEHVCVVHPLAEECRSNKLRVLHKQKNLYLYSFELQEVTAAEHVLQYLSYWLLCFHDL